MIKNAFGYAAILAWMIYLRYPICELEGEGYLTFSHTKRAAMQRIAQIWLVHHESENFSQHSFFGGYRIGVTSSMVICEGHYG